MPTNWGGVFETGSSIRPGTCSWGGEMPKNPLLYLENWIAVKRQAESSWWYKYYWITAADFGDTAIIYSRKRSWAGVRWFVRRCSMPRMPKKVKLEWSMFLRPETGRKGYNDICKKCANDCKQSYRTVLLECPRFTKKSGWKWSFFLPGMWKIFEWWNDSTPLLIVQYRKEKGRKSPRKTLKFWTIEGRWEIEQQIFKAWY